MICFYEIAKNLNESVIYESDKYNSTFEERVQIIDLLRYRFDGFQWVQVVVSLPEGSRKLWSSLPISSDLFPSPSISSLVNFSTEYLYSIVMS